MKILVTGKDDQLGRCLAERAGSGDGDWHFAGREEIDLSRPGAFAKAIVDLRPDVIINTAACTAVDRAETEEALAHRINAEDAGEGAEAAATLGIPFIQPSTDYVFDGSGERPWVEDDPVRPINAYGRTKAEGERLVLAAIPDHAVVRTSWVVSPFGQNFVKTMLRLAAERDKINVVADQHSCPTSAFDLADALLAMVRNGGQSLGGIWHVAGSGTATRADVAECVMEASASLGGPSARIAPIATADYPTPARRPRDSRLDCEKFTATFGQAMPDWRRSVAGIVERLGGET